MEARLRLLALFRDSGAARYAPNGMLTSFLAWCERRSKDDSAVRQLVLQAMEESTVALIADGFRLRWVLTPSGMTRVWQLPTEMTTYPGASRGDVERN